MNEIPRRNRLDLSTPAELAIRAAVDEVEKLPADERLTRAVILLGEARDEVADYVDGIAPACCEAAEFDGPYSARCPKHSGNTPANIPPQPTSGTDIPPTVAERRSVTRKCPCGHELSVGVMGRPAPVCTECWRTPSTCVCASRSMRPTRSRDE